MVFAPPVGVLDRVRTLEAIRNAPRWKRVVFAAECDGRSAPYRAQCSSAYVSIGGNGGWP
jgi:hypothetical protein